MDQAAASAGAILLPLALAQFLASYDTSSMSVAISNIAHDLDTTVTGVQTAISLFTLTMAALMITGSKLTDIWGRRRCFMIGIWVYGAGALITALSPTIRAMIVGFSVLEGVGSALMIPPIYILLTVSFEGTKERAKAFGVISAMAGLGAAAGPLIGGAITTALTWRASYAAEVGVIFIIWLLARARIQEQPATGPRPRLDLVGAALSALALAAIVIGILQANTYGWVTARKDYEIGGRVILAEGSISPVWLFVGGGLLLMALFVMHIRRATRRGAPVLINPRIFANRTSNLGLITQLSQWFMIVGGMFVVSVYLQVSRHHSAIETGILITPATAGILLASAFAGRLARRHEQRNLVRSGFAVALAGIGLLMLLGKMTSGTWQLAPGLFFLGVGIGVMLTASVNVVQSAFSGEEQGEISGVSRSASNLGSSLGTAIAGAVLVAGIISGVTARANDSTVLNDQQKDELSAAMQHQVSALSDSQVEEQLRGQRPAVVEEVTNIYSHARNQALGYALASVGAAGLIGLIASFGLPAAPASARDDDAPRG
jgi:MFS family permease